MTAAPGFLESFGCVHIVIEKHTMLVGAFELCAHLFVEKSDVRRRTNEAGLPCSSPVLLVFVVTVVIFVFFVVFCKFFFVHCSMPFFARFRFFVVAPLLFRMSQR
jgi:hypothetical protein